MTMFMCLLLFLFRSDRVPVRARRGLNTSVQRGAWPTSCSRIMRRITSIILVAPMRRASGVKICCACKRMSDPSNSTATVTVACKGPSSIALPSGIQELSNRAGISCLLVVSKWKSPPDAPPPPPSSPDGDGGSGTRVSLPPAITTLSPGRGAAMPGSGRDTPTRCQ